MKFEIDIRMPDVTDQQKGIDFRRRRVYTKSKVLAARDFLRWNLKPYAPEVPILGALRLVVKCYYAYNKTEKKDIVKNRIIYPRSTRPDWDNIGKGLCDILADLKFFENDAQIYSGTIEKYWAPFDKIEIEISSTF